MAGLLASEGERRAAVPASVQTSPELATVRWTSVPCPSARRPDQNRHRLADGWQGSSVRAILENPRYTGYAFFGRWTKHETLLDPDDVAAGHVTRFRRSQPDRIVRSRQPAHPAIVSVEDFTQAQLMRRTRAAGGMRGKAKLARTRSTGTRPYLFRDLIRCGICTRRMQGGTVRQQDTYYRCLARTLAPGSTALADHPRTVNMRQDALLEPLNAWIGRLFDRDNVDRTVATLVASQATPSGEPARDGAKSGSPTLRHGCGGSKRRSRPESSPTHSSRPSTRHRPNAPPREPNWTGRPHRTQ